MAAPAQVQGWCEERERDHWPEETGSGEGGRPGAGLCEAKSFPVSSQIREEPGVQCQGGLNVEVLIRQGT